MRDYFSNLAERAIGSESSIAPRPVSRFEKGTQVEFPPADSEAASPRIAAGTALTDREQPKAAPATPRTPRPTRISSMLEVSGLETTAQDHSEPGETGPAGLRSLPGEEPRFDPPAKREASTVIAENEQTIEQDSPRQAEGLPSDRSSVSAVARAARVPDRSSIGKETRETARRQPTSETLEAPVTKRRRDPPASRLQLTGERVSSRINDSAASLAERDSPGAIESLPQPGPDIRVSRETAPDLVSSENPKSEERIRHTDNSRTPVRPDHITPMSPRISPVFESNDGELEPASSESGHTVQITIGRVEIKAVTPSASKPRIVTPANPAMSLDDYLRKRSSGGRS
jgi:hypothetical protein